MSAGTVYLRSTDKAGRRTTTEHQCWDVDRFLTSVIKSVTKEGGTVVAITREQYRAEIWPQPKEP